MHDDSLGLPWRAVPAKKQGSRERKQQADEADGNGNAGQCKYGPPPVAQDVADDQEQVNHCGNTPSWTELAINYTDCMIDCQEAKATNLCLLAPIAWKNERSPPPRLAGASLKQHDKSLPMNR